jgi:hypothetical protein|tara:strand:- start:92 stop:634 length:543 start_codon:yes stop_codon:yes gene_type:complete
MAKGGTSTTMATSGLIDDLRPIVTNLIQGRADAYDEEVKDPSKIVAGLSQEQKDAFSNQKATANQMMAGQGAWDLSGNLNRDMQNTLGTGMGAASYGDALGSARSQAATNKALGDVSANYLQQRQQNITGGAEMLGNVGQAMQQQKQKVLDAPHTATSRIFSYLNAGPQQKVQTTTGGGK